MFPGSLTSVPNESDDVAAGVVTRTVAKLAGVRDTAASESEQEEVAALAICTQATAILVGCAEDDGEEAVAKEWQGEHGHKVSSNWKLLLAWDLCASIAGQTFSS